MNKRFESISSNREKEIIAKYGSLSYCNEYCRPCKSDGDATCPDILLNDDELNVDAIYPSINVALEIVSMPYKNYKRLQRIIKSTKIEFVNKYVLLLDSLKKEYGTSLADKINRSLIKASHKGYKTVLIIDHDCPKEIRIRSGFLFTTHTYAAYLKDIIKDIKLCDEVILIHNNAWYIFSFASNNFIKLDSISTS